MERIIYTATPEQLKSWASYVHPVIPSDDVLKQQGKRIGRPWSLIKKDLCKELTIGSPEFQKGMWQGRVDRARGLGYVEHGKGAYQKGHYFGYNGYQKDRSAWTPAEIKGFEGKYLV